MIVRLLASLSLCLVMLFSTAAAFAQTAGPKAVVNGKEIPGAFLSGGRIYVPAEGFAAAIGASFSRGGNGAYLIKTGTDIPDMSQLTALNPALEKYGLLTPFLPGMGIHHGVEGPGLVVMTSNEGSVNGVEVIVPAEVGWQPWFDQPKGQPMELEGLGEVYTQHVYFTSPAGLVEEGAGLPVVIDGRYLSSDYEKRGHLVGGAPFIPLRPAVALLGGQIDWDQSKMTASATVQAKGMTYAWLKEMNPALAHYELLTEFIPNMGFHVGAPGPHITLLYDSAGRVVGVELISPAAAGWFAWFDQPKDQPMELPELGPVYTQHIYLTDPAGIK